MNEIEKKRLARFMGHVMVDEATGCWNWQSRISRDGYGQFTDTTSHTVRAHRWGYEQLVGKIPEGLVLDHFRCDNKRCVNPDHLKPATVRENTLRGTAPSAVNAKKTECKHGHPFDDANTHRFKGVRYCRACNRVNVQTYRSKRRSEEASASASVDLRPIPTVSL